MGEMREMGYIKSCTLLIDDVKGLMLNIKHSIFFPLLIFFFKHLLLLFFTVAITVHC